MPRWREGSGLVVATIGLALPAPAGAATGSERWSGVADMVFQHPAIDGRNNNRLVSAIAQDRIGFIWIGTEDGLARWDGYGFRFYRPDAAKPDHLANGYVQALHVDTQGRLWIGTGSGGLSRYHLGCDCFKQVNDTLGQDAGDALLAEAAKRLQAAVRRSDYVFRLGGDEFAILLSGSPDFDLASVEVTYRRIVDGFTAPVPFKGVDMRTSPSIGIAGFPDDGTTQEDLYKAADLALYEAKQAGRNTWRWRTVPIR